MKESFEDYGARIRSYVKGRDVRRLLARTPAILERRIAGLSRRKLSTPPAKGKWSVAQILAHISEIELLWGYRMRIILESDGSPIVGMDQEAWARNSHYDRIDARRAFDTFRAIRQANLDLIDNLSPSQKKRRGIHSQFGPLTVLDILTLLAGHDVNHSRQIEQILSRRRRA